MSRPWLCLLLTTSALLLWAPLAVHAAWLPGDGAVGSEDEAGSTAATVKTYAFAIGVPLILGIAVLKLLYDYWSVNKKRGEESNDRWYAGGWRKD